MTTQTESPEARLLRLLCEATAAAAQCQPVNMDVPPGSLFHATYAEMMLRQLQSLTKMILTKMKG
jgi:hypothetical protein